MANGEQRSNISGGHHARFRSEQKPPRRSRRPVLEALEGRQLLKATLAAIPAVSVPAYLGYQVPLNGTGALGPQTFTASSSNPNIKVSVAKGDFVTLNIAHAAAKGVPNDKAFSGSVTFELFPGMTPITAQEIEQFVRDGFYNGKIFHRVANMFPGTKDFIEQGGSASGNGSGASNQPGTPFRDEFNQQLAFTGTYQVAMANSGPDSNDTQFFFTTGTPRFLDFGYTVFGQVVAGQNIINDMTKVAVNPTDHTTPLSPITIKSASISTMNPNGVLHIDATHANAGQSAVITVTAKQGTTNVTRTFNVNVVANTQVERPYVNPLPNLQAGLNQTVLFQIPAVSPTPGIQVAYTVNGGFNPYIGGFVPVANATVKVDQSTGIVQVVPNKNFSGTISLLYGVRYAAMPDTPTSYEYHTITLTVNKSATPVIQRPLAVQLVGSAAVGKPTAIQLVAGNSNAGTSPTFSYTIISPPLHGTIAGFNPAKGTLNYTPTKGYKGIDVFQYTVTAKLAGKVLTSVPAYVYVID
jgi:cyclophilin family peptidyl-prolyl cis-trans isomerase